MTEEALGYCDLVMKGGITSGVVYPAAVLELAKHYRFKNIGGTSAGAIVAAATAAAALGERRSSGSPISGAQGFTGFRGALGDLARPGFILNLFQPAPGARAAFKLVTRLAARPGILRILFEAVRAILAIAPLFAALTLGGLLAWAWWFGGTAGIKAAAPPALLCACIVGALAALLKVANAVRGNSLGLCSGLTVGSGRAPPALSDWLHQLLQSLSGQSGRPLLFSDLWEAPRDAEEPGKRAIDLQMITTGVSHREPRSLPFESSGFWFREEEFSLLFPAEVVAWMVAQDEDPLTIAGKRFYRLPDNGSLPVLVAARMSLSFPVLISAVPLHEPDYRQSGDAEAEPTETYRKGLLATVEGLAGGGGKKKDRPSAMRICWFSDGGICSNFPLHLFDAPIPRWPTFAIDLVYPGATDTSRQDVYLPAGNDEGWQRRYASITSGWAVAEVASFLFALLQTMQNWRDLLQSRAPGHRDRIVHVPLRQGEGGLNLNMPKPVVANIVDKGRQAGELLATRFDFNNHWWIRWRNVASAIERFTIDFAGGARPAPTPSYAAAHSSAWTGAPPPVSYPFTQGQQSDAQSRLKILVEQGELWADADPDLTRGAPRPLPQLRVIPTF